MHFISVTTNAIWVQGFIMQGKLLSQGDEKTRWRLKSLDFLHLLMQLTSVASNAKWTRNLAIQSKGLISGGWKNEVGIEKLGFLCIYWCSSHRSPPKTEPTNAVVSNWLPSSAQLKSLIFDHCGKRGGFTIIWMKSPVHLRQIQHLSMLKSQNAPLVTPLSNCLDWWGVFLSRESRGAQVTNWGI